MIKKIRKAFVLLLGTLSLSSCTPKEITPILLGNSSLKTVTYVFQDSTSVVPLETLKTKIKDNNENMFLCVYGSKTCACWQHFVSGCLNTLINNYHTPVYCLEYQDLKEYNESDKDKFFSFLNKGLSSSGETFYLINNGKNIYHKVYSENDKFFTDYETFYNSIKGFIKFPSIITSNLEEVKKQTITPTDDKEHLIFHRRSTCPDCSYLEKDFLKEYVLKNDVLTISSLDWDSNEISSYPGGKAAFKEAFGLTSSNTKFGFGDGYVPSLQVWKSGQIIDSIVIFNDTIILENNEYKISSSFFSKDRINSISYLDKSTYSPIEGKVISKDEIESFDYEGKTYYSWKHDNAFTSYKSYLTSFLDKYFKNGI